MKLLVTGGAGFIGSNFVRTMLDEGHTVITVDALTYAGNLENLGDYYSHKNHTFYKETICDKEALRSIIFKHTPEVIVHMAAESHVDRSIDCADEFVKTNVLGTQTLLDVALGYYKTITPFYSFRFLHISTDEVFGALGQMGKFYEQSPYDPHSPYAASKAAGDHFVRAYFYTYGLPIILAHPSNTYGPRQYPEKLIPLTILNALEGKKLPLYGNGQQVRDWLYVDDHVSGLYALIKEGIVGESYCIGAENEMTNKVLVETVCDILDEISPRQEGSYKELISFVTDRPGHDFRYATSPKKIKTDTYWTPRMPFRQGLERTIQWYRDHALQMRSKEGARQRIGLG